MSGMLGPFWHEARALVFPVGAYWAALVLSLGLFSTVLLIYEGAEQQQLGLIVAVWIACLGGVALGQGLALLRLRLWLVLGLSALAWIFGWTVVLSAPTATSASGPGELLFAIGVFAVFLGPLFVACGFWSVSANTSMFAAWGPIVWFTASILKIGQETRAIENWHLGEKWAIWNLLTAPILGSGIVLVLVYLAARELHRLHRWRYSPLGPAVAPAVRSRGVRIARATPGLGGIGMLLLLGLFLTVASALVAPYLWRAGPGDREGVGGDVAQEQAIESGDRDRTEWQTGEQSEQAGIGGSEVAEQARRAAKQAVFSLLMLLLMLLLALAALLVFGPPLRRMLLLQHFRRPLWPVPPTRRIQHSWRVVEIALGDLGVYRRPGDSAAALARRATAQIRLVDPDALLRCADIADRVRFGIGVLPDDTMRARRTAEMTYQTVWEELTEAQKFRAMYRFV